ncbi:MAG: uridine kinase, partial [Ornithinimicrobium sp.]
VLTRFRAGRVILPADHDVATDQAILPDAIEAAEDPELLVDGVFLHRPELTSVWDASLFVHTPFEISVPRGNARLSAEQTTGADRDDPDDPVHARYVQAQRWYLEQAPAQQATWVLDNSNLSQPLLDWGAEVGP